MRLRPYLGLLVAGAIVPVAFLAVVLSAVLVERARDTFRLGVQERAHAASKAVDDTIEGSIATLQALGAALEVDHDYAEFREVATRILATQRDWSNINLALPSGQQVVNLQRPQGAKLHSIAGVDDSLEIIHRTHGPVVNDLGFGTATQAWDIAVRVPIVREGEIRYILTGVVRPEAAAGAVAAQNLPANWTAYVVDRKGRVIGEVREGAVQRAAGNPAPPVLASFAAERVGWRHIAEGEQYAALQRSAVTGWSTLLLLPAAAVDAPAWQAAWSLAGGLLTALVLAVALAYYVGRRWLVRPIEALASATTAVGRGEAVPIPEVRSVSEVNAFAAALRTAVEAMREREQLLHREKAALASADRAKTEFIAMLSHELRNPLAALTAAAHVLKLERAHGAAVPQVQSIIERQTQQMTRLVEDLLDISRVTMGKAELKLETLDLGALARHLVSVWRSAGRLDRHKVSIDAAEAWVRADRARMEQILSNLLDNALKFTPPGGAIAVTVRESRDEALVQVRDEGAGLAPGMAEHVFDLFVQGESPAGRVQSGLGIGLALVRRLVEMHAGQVHAESEGRGRGATFTVRLPGARPAALAEAKPQEIEKPRKALRVLLVEDNDDTRRMMSRALAHAGHEVREAADGKSAISLAAGLRPDVVVLDIGLPDIDGYEVARRLRASPPARAASIVAVTGYGRDEDRRRARAAGIDAHLTKPVSPDVLARAIGDLAP